MLHGSPPTPQPSPIADCFARCSHNFKQFYIALAGEDCQFSEKVPLSQLSDEYGRLGVWGANSAADRTGRGSLDDVLRDDPELRSIILEILRDLCHDLEYGMCYANSPSSNAKLKWC
jgi:hypothetical protein